MMNLPLHPPSGWMRIATLIEEFIEVEMNENGWKVVEGNLLTRWAGEVDPRCPLPEYPRPQMARERWMNLNGLWDYAVVERGKGSTEAWEGKILVPFAIEAALSGVKKPLLPTQRLWYRRTFEIPADWAGERVLLHFGAVDFEAEVWVNGCRVGSHRGGYLPFQFEISQALVTGENTVTVAVWDPTDTGMQERGKQKLKPAAIWYSAVSGIWQTVWLEPVPWASIDRLKITPDFDRSEVRIEVEVAGKAGMFTVRAEVGGEGQGVTGQAAAGEAIRLSIPQAHAWTPEDPHIYPVKVSLWEGAACIDAVESYFALRKYSLAPDQDGHLRFCLNDQSMFLYGPLDQGYYPDGLYTAPTEAAMVYDVDLARRLGFNFIRKHIKVEPQRWYAYCDRVGMIVWQDMPSGGKAVSDLTAILAQHAGLRRRDDRLLWRAGRQHESDCDQYRTDLKGMVDWLYNHPCIAVWVQFNEGWGQFMSKEIADWLKQYDPSRLIDAASGWFDQGGGDFVSEHQYVLRLRGRKGCGPRAFVLSEFGGYSLVDKGHAWNLKKKCGYKFFADREGLTDAYLRLLTKELVPLIAKGLAAAVYTEICDVEIEVNGFVTYDRAVEKMDFGRVEEKNKSLSANTANDRE